MHSGENGTADQNKHARERLWSCDFVLLCISRTFNSLVFNLLTVVVAPYCMYVYGANAGQAGLAVGAYIVAALSVRVFVGPRQDAIGRGRMLKWGALMFALCTVLYLLPLTLPLFTLVRVLHGMSFGIVSNVTTVVATELIPIPRRGEGLGYFALGATIASAIGPFVGTWLLHHSSSFVLFGTCSLFAIASFVSVAPIKVHEVSASSLVRHGGGLLSKIGEAFEVAAIPMSSIMFLLAMCYTSVTAFLSDYAIEVGLGYAAPWYFLAYAAAAVVVRPIAGRICDAKGDAYVIYPMIPAFAVGVLLLATCSSVAQMLLSAVFLGAGFTSVFACIQTCVIGRSSDERMSVATSTFYIFTDAGHGLGPMVLGSTVAFFEYRGMLFLDALIVCSMLFVYWAMCRKKTKDSVIGG